MKEISELRGCKILVDTNVLIDCGREEFGADFRKILRTLTDNKNQLAISQLSGFEIVKKFHRKKEVIAYYVKLLNFLPNIELSTKVLGNAGIIAHALYPKNKNGETEEFKKDNDFIIGASVITHKGSLLLTCNRKDFNQPLWKVVARECVYWDDGDKRKVENVYLLEPDFDELKKRKLF